MKKIITTIFLSALCFPLAAQKSPLRGSGKIISRNVQAGNFDTIILNDLAGLVEITAGKPYSVSIEIDDNLEPLLTVSVKDSRLEMGLIDNRNNRRYIENTNIRIRVTLPELHAVEHLGNNQLKISGIAGRYFRLYKSGNGDVQLNGSTGRLEITKAGNGDINGTALLAQQALVQSSGNGDVQVNAEKEFSVTASGNGDVKNTGTARASELSSRTGNGEIIDAAYQPVKSPYPAELEDTRIQTRIQNRSGKWVELKIVLPVKRSYGVDLKPGGLRKEYFPLGTKIYRQGTEGTPLFEITPANRDTVLVIEN